MRDFLYLKKGGNEYIDEKWREIGIILFEIRDWKKENIHGKKKGDFLIRNKGKKN